MATHYIFIDGEDTEKGLGMNSRYVFRFETLIVYRNERVIYCEEAHKGDAFVAMCENGRVIMKKMVPPNQSGRLVAWLMGYQKHCRAESESDYEEKLAKYRRRYDWSDYVEWEYRSDGYVFTRCNNPYSEEPRNVAGFFSDAITKSEILQLVPLMKYHPDWYVQKILQNRFNISEEEFKKARNSKF